MLEGLLGKKVGMTQYFLENGECVPVTVVEAGPMTVMQKKTVETDGYDAVQVGFQPITGKGKLNKVTQALKGHFKEQDPVKTLREFKADDINSLEIGQKIGTEIFEVGQIIDVAGTSKGRGFAGTIKRHGFSGGPGSHGHRSHRLPGSIGQSATPGRVFKNKKMAGHYGNERVTIQNLKIVEIKPELNLILIKGSIPGPNGRLVEVRRAAKG